MRILLLVFVLLAACRSNSNAAHDKPTSSTADAGLARAQLGVLTRDGQRLPVRVELALTPQEQQRGLMFRREMGENDGMLFVFPDDQVHTFWMHNTLIPLDMLFIGADGSVVGIVPDATPQTDTPRTVGKRSRYVLEVNGGWCERHGVQPGDRVELGDALAVARSREAP